MIQQEDDQHSHGLTGRAPQLAGRLPGHVVLVITALVGGLLVAGLTAAGSEVYEAVAEKDGLSGLDWPALELAIRWRTPLTDQLVTWFTNLGGPVGMTIIAAAVTILMVWRWRSPTPLILMVIAVAGSLTFTHVGKAIVGRARPPLTDAIPPYEYAFSFPSGHTLNSTVIAGMIAYLVARRLTSGVGRALCGIAAVIWAVAMGLSRVFLGHHWLTDVIFAWLIGLAWLALLITAHRIFLIVRDKQRTRVAATWAAAEVERPR
jgi:membrane-associated phospholipid phosphatase